jgi:protein ImuA
MAPHPALPDPVRQVRELARLLEQAGLGGNFLAGAGRAAVETFSTGVGPLDRRLPRQGFSRGSLVEWLVDAPGAPAALLALSAAREAQRDGGAVVVIDRNRGFYPPAAAAWRIDLASLIVVHPQSEADERWALDQSLRCEHVAAVLAWPRRIDDVTFRRLQLAAESSGAVGLLVRPAAAQREPSWAEVRLLVAPRPATSGGWRLNLTILRCRGSTLVSRDAVAERAAELALEINDTTGDIHEAHPRHLAPQLAHPATPKQQA